MKFFCNLLVLATHLTKVGKVHINVQSMGKVLKASDTEL